MKAQALVVKELFVFLFGFFVLLGVIYVFSRIITPTITEFSVKAQVGVINSYVNYMIIKSYEFSKESAFMNVSMIVNMPKDIAGYQYAVNVENNTVCTITLFGIVRKSCKHLTINATVNGGYISGGSRLVINSFKNENKFEIVLGTEA